MSTYVPNDGIEDGDDGDDNVFTPFSGREGTIYLIDVAKFKDPEKGIFENKDHFLTCLDCIEADLLKGIMINARDLVSVVFYNTLNSPAPDHRFAEDSGVSTVVPTNCAVLIPLKPLSKDLIQYFKSFKDSEDFFDFDRKYGSSDESCFHEALWLCSRMMSQSNYKLGTSKVILFTNNELPHPDKTNEQTQAISRAGDLLQNNIYVELVPMVDDFDTNPFFKEFLCAVEGIGNDQFTFYCPKDQRYRLLNRVYRANYKNSCLRHLNFELADGVAMACDIFSFTRTAKKPNAVKMFRSNNEMVIAKRCHVVEEKNPEDEDEMVHRKVLPGELYKSQTICSKEIVFSPAEVINMKSLQNPGLRLLGFKSLDQLRPRWMIKHCLFLYPNEKKTIGSTTLFRALWEKCLEKEKFALCTLTMRRVATPKYVALVPQTQDAHGNDGFCIIHMPMETNISVLDSVIQPLAEPTPEQVSLMEKMCKKLRFQYRPEAFSNPALQSFYANLEAQVYDEQVREIEDLTMPEYHVQDEKIEHLIQDIEDEFGIEAAASKGKRAADGDANGARPKASKKDLSPNDVEQAIRNEQMGAVTIEHLKTFLREKNARFAASATKKVLFELAQKHV